MEKRIEFIDYAKGVCIMFIVLFHEQVSRLPYAAKWGGTSQPCMLLCSSL